MNTNKLPVGEQNSSCLPAPLPAQAVAALEQHGILPKNKNTGKTIEILRTLFLRGPSIWTYRPALEAWVDLGELENYPSNKLPGFPERLAAWLPTLVEHRCGIGERGGFLQRLRDGTWAGHILEHVMIELQTLAGIDSGFGKARETSRIGVYKVVVRTPDETVGLAALQASRELVMAAIEDRPCDVAGMVQRLRALAAQQCPGAAAQCLLDAAQARKIPWMRIGEGRLIQLGHGQRARRMWAHEPLQTGAIAETIVGKRALCASLLRGAGIAVADSRIVDDAEEAWAEAQEIGLPVVLAAVERTALAASPALHDQKEIMDAYTEMAASGQRLVVEQALPGSLHRLLVVGGRVVSALRLDAGSAGLVDVSAQVHPDTADLAELAARVVGLRIAGIDIVASDISRPLQAQQGALVCVNARPDAGVHAQATPEAWQRVGQALLAHFYGEEDKGRIPVVGVTGSTGTTLVSRLVARLLQAGGKQVGLACGEGVYLNQRQIEASQGHEASQRVLINPSVECAVIETSFAGILASGLGYDRCAVGVVTGIDCDDTLPEFFVEEEAQLVNVARTQVDVVLPEGCAVLNAADSRVAELARLSDGEVMFFASHDRAPVLAEHLANGGRAVFMRAGRMVFAKGNTQTPIALPEGLPMARTAEMTQVLAAAAAAWALQMSPHAIGAELAVFFKDLRSAFIHAVPSASAGAN